VTINAGAFVTVLLILSLSCNSVFNIIVCLCIPSYESAYCHHMCADKST
jgi:hypothetical protein